MSEEVCVHGHTMETECLKCNKLLVDYLKRMLSDRKKVLHGV